MRLERPAGVGELDQRQASPAAISKPATMNSPITNGAREGVAA
jgi:hypothetical protein